MDVRITALYAAPLALLLIALSLWVAVGWFRYRVSVDAGNEAELEKRNLVKASCAEYAPIGILLLLLMELLGAPGWLLHLCGISLLAGRVAHAIGFGSEPERILLRRGGMILTFAAITLAAIVTLTHALI